VLDKNGSATVCFFARQENGSKNWRTCIPAKFVISATFLHSSPIAN
jgi:hypothetical protein